VETLVDRRSALRSLVRVGAGLLLAELQNLPCATAKDDAVASTRISPDLGMKVSYVLLPKQPGPRVVNEWGSVAQELVDHWPRFSNNDPTSVTVEREIQAVAALRSSHVTTRAHEITHGLQSQVARCIGSDPAFANIHNKQVSSGITEHHNLIQPVYLGHGRVAIVDEPAGISYQEICATVPGFARNWSRYKDYLIMASKPQPPGHHQYTPNYLLNEFGAYNVGARAALNLHDHFAAFNARSSDTKISFDAGQAEFALFGLTLAMITERQGGAFRSETKRKQFLSVVAALVEDSEQLERELCDTKRFPFYNSPQRTPVFKELGENPECAPLRVFMARVYGAEWTQAIISGDRGGRSLVEWSELVRSTGSDGQFIFAPK
jgi:hypothetical protein